MLQGKIIIKERLVIEKDYTYLLFKCIYLSRNLIILYFIRDYTIKIIHSIIFSGYF